MSNSKSPAIYFVLVTVVIDITGFGIIIPVLPTLLSKMENISINEASAYGGYLISVWPRSFQVSVKDWYSGT